MPEPFNDAERKLWWTWVAAAVIGPALTAIVMPFVTRQFPELVADEVVFIFFVVLLSLPQALVESYALRPFVKKSWWWVVAAIPSTFITTSMLSFVQWFALRRWVRRAWWWPLFGFMLWYGSTLYVARLADSVFELFPLWLIKGGLSGLLMVILLREPLQPGDGNEFETFTNKAIYP